MRRTYLQMKVPQKMRSNVFKTKHTIKKTPPMFLDVKALTQRRQLRFWTLSIKRKADVYVCSV